MLVDSFLGLFSGRFSTCYMLLSSILCQSGPGYLWWVVVYVMIAIQTVVMHQRVFLDTGKLLAKSLTDANAPALDKALEALLVLQTKCSVKLAAR